MFPPEELRAVFGADLEAVEAEPLGGGVPAATAGVWLEALAEPAWTIDGYGLTAGRLGVCKALSPRLCRASAGSAAVAAPRMLEARPTDLLPPRLYPENLFGDGDDTIVVDWAYCGIGALGEDLGNFVADALLDGFVDAEDAAELKRTVWGGLPRRPEGGRLRGRRTRRPIRLLRDAVAPRAAADRAAGRGGA